MAPLRCYCPCPSALVAAIAIVLSPLLFFSTTSSAKTSFVALAFSFSTSTASLGRPPSPHTTSTSKRLATQLAAGTKATIDDETIPSVPVPPWYSDPTILRDRSHVTPSDRGFDYRLEEEGGGGEVCLSPTLSDVLARPTSHIIPFQDGKVFVKRADSKDGIVEPLFLRYTECDPGWFNCDATISWLGGQESATDEDNSADYFALDIPSHVDLESLVRNDDGDCIVESAAVRNYGDAMPSRSHAALLATANGLLSFHASHRFCARCGSPTKQIKAGSARKCSADSCGASVYPRIDPAVIMLVTSPCRNYALLGRKKSWPSGRYSTLAGFVEVGETLEECVVRETLEESGVRVDPASIRFSASQPWPFPRSMMLGYHATAATCKTSLGADDLPSISIDPAELEDAQWFSKEYVREHGLVEGRGSSALDFEPDEEEAAFHVPGPASLARLLITEWVRGE